MLRRVCAAGRLVSDSADRRRETQRPGPSPAARPGAREARRRQPCRVTAIGSPIAGNAVPRRQGTGWRLPLHGRVTGEGARRAFRGLERGSGRLAARARGFAELFS